MSQQNKQYDARQVLKEYLKRHGDLSGLQEDNPDAEKRSFAWHKHLLPQQMEYIADETRLKTALCSRRAGKTYASCYYLIETAMKHAESTCAYIALTRSSAKKLMWSELQRANRKYYLNMHFNNSELTATFPNHSQIMLTGANDEADIDKLRGLKYQLVILDEAGSFGRHIDALVEEVLEPALIDCDGTLAMIGTPTASCSGFFYEASTGLRPGFSQHHWTILENSYIPHAAEYLDRKRDSKGWSADNPVYQREWCGRWVRSDDSLVYRYHSHNIVDDLPDDFDFEFILGVDLGYHDATAFVVMAYCRDLPHVFIVDCQKQSKMLPTDIAERIGDLAAEYDFTRIVADTGGLGKSIVEEFKIRYGLPIYPAEKTKKLSYIEMMNADLADGILKVTRGSDILDEWRNLQWDEDHRKEDGRFENHLADAALYAWRECRHYRYEAPIEPPKYGTPEYWDMIEDKHWAESAKNLDRNDSDRWWATGTSIERLQ